MRINNITLRLTWVPSKFNDILNLTTVVTSWRPPSIIRVISAYTSTSNITIKRDPTIQIVITIVLILITRIHNSIWSATNSISPRNSINSFVAEVIQYYILVRRDKSNTVTTTVWLVWIHWRTTNDIVDQIVSKSKVLDNFTSWWIKCRTTNWLTLNNKRYIDIFWRSKQIPCTCQSRKIDGVLVEPIIT